MYSCLYLHKNFMGHRILRSKRTLFLVFVFGIGLLFVNFQAYRIENEGIARENDSDAVPQNEGIASEKDSDSVPQSTFCHNSNCILLLGYVRGGTTMTLDVLAQVKNNFYVFEPLNALTEDSNARVPVKFYNNTVKNITDKDLPRRQAEMLVNWFNCDVNKLNTGDLKSTHLAFHSKSTRSYFSCMRKKGLATCIRMLQSACESKNNRIIKVVRLRIKTLNFILKKFTNLKVVYIVRDPRAQMNSLVQTKLINAKDIEQRATYLCNDMMQDVEAIKNIKRTYTKNIITVKYETLVRNPIELFRKMYHFAHLNFTDKVQTYILNHLMGSSKRRGGYWLTLSGDAKTLSSDWRTSINMGHVRVIDSVCQSVYRAFGYKYLDIKSLRNRNISLLTKPSINDILDIY